ncbi:MAG: hypothetical protein V7719_06580 [Psychroserpens sp.]|uniref:hypothetical protein n=1 Tax=Psychroserpens sp. TaxID=2020870 RepID=UPI0030033A92
MKSKLFILAFSLIVFSGCRSDKNMKETSITKVEGNSDIINLDNVELSVELLKKGVKLKSSVIKDSPAGGSNNLLTLQLIFENDFKDVIYIKVIDKTDGKGKRAKLEVEGQNGRVDNYDFIFGKSVQIEVNSLILVE